MRKLDKLSTSLGFILSAAILASCGANAPSGGALPATTAAPTSQSTVAPAATQAPATPQPSVVAQPSENPYPVAGESNPLYPPPGGSIIGLVDAPEDLQQRVRSALAQRLGMAAEGLKVQQAMQEQWPNSALGCPDPAKSYTNEIVPGYRMILYDGQRDYVIHTTLLAAPGEPIILCENKLPQDIAPQAQQPILDQSAQQMLNLAARDLAQSLGVDPATVSVVNVEPVEWNDSSLGCPKPDLSYMQVITPGYLIRLKVAEQVYEYHTDKTSAVIRCVP